MGRVGSLVNTRGRKGGGPLQKTSGQSRQATPATANSTRSSNVRLALGAAGKGPAAVAAAQKRITAGNKQQAGRDALAARRKAMGFK